MQYKNQKKSFVFEIISFEVFAANSGYCDGNTCQQVNILTNSPKISALTNAEFPQLNLSQIHGKLG